MRAVATRFVALPQDLCAAYLESYAKHLQSDDELIGIPENGCTVSAPFQHRFSDLSAICQRLYLENYPDREPSDERFWYFWAVVKDFVTVQNNTP